MLLGNSTTRDSTAFREAFALAARARGDAQFSAHRSGCDAQESRKSGRPAIPNGDGAAVPAGLPRVIRNPLRIGPAAIRKILLLGLGVDSACSRPARCRRPSGVPV